ncbi:glycosyltransferase [Frigidibacter sp. MR17.24]|uniref:glycosyltransferase n=1 Tax=Frigidibacter sp. MR17.24 TaxID=3127345 RepID=UPI003012DCE4
MSGDARVAQRTYGSADPWAAAITIPARNEADRVSACLDAAAIALAGRGGIVVTVNGSTDATLDLVRAWFVTTGTSGVVINDPAPPVGSGVGRARRLAIAAACVRLRQDGTILTTDADSRVAPDWLDANLAELTRADLVCGTVLPEPAEISALPAIISEKGAPEGEYFALTLAIRALLDPVPHDLEPTHINPAGASLAFRMPLYTDVGGIPDIAVREDRVFVEHAESRDWRVRHSSIAQVWTSCRLDGRTGDGMSRALRERIDNKDPIVDEALNPADLTILQARVKGQLRREFAGKPGFGAAWAQALETRPELRSHRMFLSELQTNLPQLRSKLAELQVVPTDRSPTMGGESPPPLQGHSA